MSPAALGVVSSALVRVMAAWYDASDAASIMHSAGSVSQWNDKTDNARHLVQATSTKRPTTGLATQNGLNVLTFDGGDLMTFNNSSTVIGTNGLTVFSVFKKTGAAQSPEHVPPSLSSTNQGRPCDGHGTSRHYNSASAHLGTGTGTPLDVRTQTAWCVMVWQLDAVNWTEWKDGTQTFSRAHGSTYPLSTTGQTICVGKRVDEATMFLGEVAELRFYNSVLPTVDRQSVEDHLATKWGTP